MQIKTVNGAASGSSPHCDGGRYRQNFMSYESVILLIAAFVAVCSLPLQKAQLDGDSLAISAMAVLWGLV